jgi:hypothetical protein
MEKTGAQWQASIPCTNCKKEIRVTDLDVKRRYFDLPDAKKFCAYAECPHCGIHCILPSLFFLLSAGRAVFYSVSA